MTPRRSAAALLAGLLVATLAACGGGWEEEDPKPPRVGDTVALTASGRLISFDRSAPGSLVGSVGVTGLSGGETLLGIDRRPADGKLYGLGSSGNLYTLDAATGAATLKRALKAAAGDDAPYSGLAGTRYGIDFDPVADRLRVVSDAGQNLRINVDNGDTTTDGTLAAGARASSVAYTNAFAGTRSTRLFHLDLAAGLLHLQEPPEAGTLDAGVPLGVSATGSSGFDIDPRSNTGYAVLTVGAETALYRIDLSATANAASRIGAVAGGEPLVGIALASVPAPSGLALTADNRLVSFALAAPNTLTGSVAVTGLGAGETLVGIDFRPKDGRLYGLSSGARLYTIDPASGAATLRAALTADPTDRSAPFAGLTGTGFSVDFNPVADRLRVISNTGLNLRIAVETATTGGVAATAGQTITDAPINRTGATPPVIAAAAYTQSFAGSTATALYGLEQNSDQLARQDAPDNGTLVNVGALGVNIAGAAGFDIAGGDDGLALAALRSSNTGPFSLYAVSLTTGAAAAFRNTAAASQIGGASGPANLVDLAIRF